MANKSAKSTSEVEFSKRLFLAEKLTYTSALPGLKKAGGQGSPIRIYYGNSIAFAIRSFDPSLSTQLITHYPFA
jgi:hypothetical protein